MYEIRKRHYVQYYKKEPFFVEFSDLLLKERRSEPV